MSGRADRGDAGVRATRTAGPGETVVDTSGHDHFETARDTITPLQQRVLNVLGPEPRGLAEIAEAAGLSQGNHPDQVTARNVLGWLASKGLAEPNGSTKRWRRPE